MATFLVTGASRGIGLEFVRQLKSRGDLAIAVCRKPTSELKEVLGDQAPLIADVTDAAAIGRLAGSLDAVDVLINNAGVSSKAKSIGEVTAEDLQSTFLVNATSPMLVAQAALPSMRKGQRKTIVNISSMLGSITQNNGGWGYGYRASKSALNMLSVSLAHELKPEGFTVLALHPGWVQTDMGGPEAPMSVQQSVKFMLGVIDKAGPGQTGRFLNYDGQPMPW